MCGIASVSRVTDATREVMKHLVYEIEERGGDSWGCTDGVQVDKWTGRITENWRQIDTSDGMPLVVHTRNATIGAIAERNSHPWVIRKGSGEMIAWDETTHALSDATDGCVIGVHNGCLRNHVEMKAKYNERAEWEVDSTHVFGHIARGLPDNEIQGWGAIVWFDGGVMKLARFNMVDLAARVTEDGIVIVCSKDGAIVKAARMVGVGIGEKLEIAEGYEYTIVEGGIVKGVKRGFGGNATIVTGGWRETWSRVRSGGYEFDGSASAGNRSGGRVYYSGNDDDDSVGQGAADTCWKCQSVKIGKTEVVCDACLKIIQDRVASGNRRVLVYVGE